MSTCSPQLSARVLDFSLHCKTQTLYLLTRTPDGKIYEFDVDLTPLFTGCDGQSLLIDTRFDNPTIYTNGNDEEVLKFDIINVATGDITGTQEVILPATGLPIGGSTGQHLVKVSGADYDVEWADESGGGGVTDHGLLTGLADDDHPQYHNDARGDLRYAPIVHTHVEADVTDLDRVRWMGPWLSQAYAENDMVKDGDWTSVANKATSDRPAPQPDGPPENSIGDTFTQDSDISIVKMVHEYTILQDGFLESLAINPAFWDFNVVTKITTVNSASGETNIYLNPLMIAGEWNILRRTSMPVTIGSVFTVEFEYYNTTPASEIRGNWNSNIGVGAPAVGEVNIDNASVPTSLVYSNTDGDAVDRTAALQGVVVNSIILITEAGDNNRFLHVKVSAVDTSQPTYTTYSVTVIDVGNSIRNNKTTHNIIDVPISVPSEYNVAVDYYDGSNPVAFANIVTELYYDGVQQADVNDGYGINIGFQKATVSPDWDLVAYSSVNDGGSGGGGGAELLTELLDTPADYIGHALDKVIVRADELGIEFVPDGGGGCPGLEPYLNTIDASEMNINTTQDFNIVGGNFDSLTTVVFSGNTAPVINSITIVDDHNMVINVTADGTTGVATLVVKNCESASFGNALSINVIGFDSNFIYSWESTAGQTLTLPLVSGYNYNFTIDWGDGSGDTITAWNQAERSHQYSNAAIHTVTISGVCEAWKFNAGGSYLAMRTLENLGDCNWLDLYGAFKTCYLMTKLDVGDCDTTNVTSFRDFMPDVYATNVNIDDLDMDSCTSLLGMLKNTKMTSLDLRGWKVNNVENFGSFLYSQTQITSLNITGWVTSSATSFNGTFRSCNKLTLIDVSQFDMSNVDNIFYMFYGCVLLNTLDTSGWNLSSCTNMGYAFLGTTNLLTLDASNWAISSVCVSLRETFNNCGMTAIDVSGWDTSGITDMVKAFWSVDNLVSFDGSNWNVSNVIYFNQMFEGSPNLITINVAGWNLSVVNTTTTSMFSSCALLTTLNLTGWTVRKVTAANSMFWNMDSMVTLDISNWDLSNCVNLASFINGCAKLESINVSGVIFGSVSLYNSFGNNPKLEVFNADNAYTANVNNMGSLMGGNGSLTVFKTAGWDTGNVTTLVSAFIQCTSLASLNLSHWNVSSVTLMGTVFQLCSNLASLNTTGWDTSNVLRMDSMFRDALLMSDVDISHWDVSSVNSIASQGMALMFYNVVWNTIRYDAALAAWAGLTTPPSTVTFHAGQTSQYTDQASRDVLTGTYGWLITDGGAV